MIIVNLDFHDYSGSIGAWKKIVSKEAVIFDIRRLIAVRIAEAPPYIQIINTIPTENSRLT